MKRKPILALLSLLLCLALLPFAALAEDDDAPDEYLPFEERTEDEESSEAVDGLRLEYLTASGSVVGASEVAVKAAVTGDLMPFSLREGDLAASGALLFGIETEKLYAGYDGVAGGVMVKPGDLADVVSSMYSALMYIEPDNSYLIKSNTSDAYDDPDNKYLHVGTKVYLKSRNNTKYKGEGQIIGVDGNNFTVEVLGGNLRYAESVNIYLKSDHSNESRIGKGDVTRVNPIAVNAAGTVIAVHVSEGEHVKKGDLLIEYVPDSLPPEEALNANICSVIADQALILSNIAVTQGSRATKGQVLARAYPKGSMQISVNVDESFVSQLKVGGAADIEFENVKSGQVRGKIASISYINSSDSSDCQYTVYVDFTPDSDIRIGMHATVSFEL